MSAKREPALSAREARARIDAASRRNAEIKGGYELVKVRRQGNSLAVTLDQKILAAADLHEGDLVQASVVHGNVLLTPVAVAPRVRQEVLDIGRRVVRENADVLDRLARDEG
ncbi:MAG TPA: hypothetical protein VFM93_07110 [Candidatus Limnocylindria bacterium]|nr:hypothetical protein [Candidatus Limnocylindria bacterium]